MQPSRACLASYSLLLLLGAPALGDAKRPRPSGALILDADAPFVDVLVAGAPLHLRVDLDRQDSVELNHAVTARLPLKWEDGHDMEIGRVRLPGRAATGMLELARRKLPVAVTDHGRDWLTNADGEIGPDLLPYATVTWHRADAPGPTRAITLPLESDASTGLSSPDPTGVQIKFSLDQPITIATATAASLLASGRQARWDGMVGTVPIQLGITRPARPILLSPAPTLAGFHVERLMVRVADYAAGGALPNDPVPGGDVEVRGRQSAIRTWPAVVIGRDRLGRCAEIVYTALPRTLTLRCAFDQ